MRFKKKKVFYEFGEIDKTNNRITEMLTVEGLEKSKKIEALIDTGAQRSLIDLKLASEIGIKLTGEINRVGGLESDSEKLEGKIRIELDNSNNRYMTVKDATVDLILTLWPNLNQRVGFPLLLGMDFWLAAEKRNMKFSLNLD
jgi:predicted aspartyl protease